MSEPRPIVILGSTGSIGVQALAVAKALPQHLRVVGLAAGSNVELFAQQIAEWQPEIAALHDEAAARRLSEYSTGNTKIVSGAGGVQEVATWPNAQLVLGAMLGSAGLTPTLSAIEAGKDIAIANKETLVAAGEIVVEAARRKNVALLPVDSEHSAIAQCLLGEESASVTRLTITASGGPFADTPRAELEQGARGSGAKAPDVVDGAQNHGRFGHANEQGPGIHRGAMALRRADGADRCCGASAKHRAFAGDVLRWQRESATRRARYAPADSVGAFASATSTRKRAATRHYGAARPDV
jgi:hypothetical protein